MKQREFRYDVHTVLEFSGVELMVLRELSQSHYDGWCKSVSQHKGFLYGWINRFIMITDSEENREKPDWEPAIFDAQDPDVFLKKYSERTVQFAVKNDELDTINKILEGMQYRPETKPGQKVGQDLWWTCIQAMKKLVAEWKRVNEPETEGSPV